MPDPKETHLPASEADVTDHEKTGREARDIDADAGLSPVVEQQGGAAIANIGKRNGSELFKPD